MFNIIGKVALVFIGAVGITATRERIELDISLANVILFTLFVVVFAVGLVDILKWIKGWIKKIY